MRTLAVLALLLAGCPAAAPWPAASGPFDTPWRIGDPAPVLDCPTDGDADGDGVPDCGDPEIAALVPCSEEWTCCVRGVLELGDTFEGATDDPGALDRIDAWSGRQERSPGPEYTFLFAASEAGSVEVLLDGGAGQHVAAWPADNGPCAPTTFVSSGITGVVIDVLAGSRWYVTVDGVDAGDFTLTVGPAR